MKNIKKELGKKMKNKVANLTLSIALIFCFSCKIQRKQEVIYDCNDDVVICVAGKPVGKIFYESTSAEYLDSYNKTLTTKSEAISSDSIIHKHIIGDARTTMKIRAHYNSYFRQFLAYKDSRDGIRYFIISFHKNFNPFLLKYWTGVDDGKDDYFFVKFDIDNGKVIKYQIN